jgi:hypothetical protein
MTTQPTAPIETPPVQVKPHGNSRLAQLHALYPDAKAKADAAAEELKAITDGIKAELVNQAPDAPRVDLIGASGPVLELRYVESWRLDAGRMKREDPETYVRFAKQSHSWRLAAAKGPQGGGQ